MILNGIRYEVVKVLFTFVSELVVKIDLAGENLASVGRVACSPMMGV